MVGIAGFEPATSRPPDERATRLRYTPMFWPFVCDMRSILPGTSGLTAVGGLPPPTRLRDSLSLDRLIFTPRVLTTGFILGYAHSGLFRVAIPQSRSAFTT